MKKLFFFILAAAILVASCQKAETPLDPNLIAFKANGLEFKASTRATVVNDSNLGTIKVNCTTGSAGSESAVWSNVSFTKASSTYTGGQYWPSSDASYHFYATNAATLTHAAAGPTISASDSTDIVCAYMPSPTFRTTNTLNFKHIFARIGDVTFSAASGYTITGVTVSITPKTGGTYNLRTGNGQTDGTGWSSTSNGSATIIANSTGTNSNDLYLVPGQYTLTAGWTAARGSFSKSYSGKTQTINVVGGKVNAITATLSGEASEIDFSVSVEEWGENTIAIGTYPI